MCINDTFRLTQTSFPLTKIVAVFVFLEEIYIIDNGVHYAIDERPWGTGEYSLGVRIGKEGNYSLSLNSINSDYDVFLIDKEANETTNLSENAYSFESFSQTANNRFVVKILSKGGETSIDNATTDKIGFTINGHRLSVNQETAISIHTIDGKLIYSGKLVDSIELPSGIYLLSTSNAAHKIVIK